MSEWRIPLSDLDYGPEEVAAVQRVLQSKWLSMGPETKAFEDEFAVHIGVKHAIAVSNGTAALHLALLALGIGPDDEVIQPAVNFVASANMTKAVGATPVFGDIVGLDEPTLAPAEIQRLMTPRTKAVVVMHYGGNLCRMAEILDLCRRHGLFVIEDACHAVGAQFVDAQKRPPTGQNAGNLGDIASFSFFSNKNLVTGEGGMVTTSRNDLDENVRHFRSHGMSTLTWDRHRGHASTYDVLAHGYNYRLDDLRSALGREQLKKLEHNNQRRRELTALYWQKLQPLEAGGWTIPFMHKSEVRGQQSVVSGQEASCHLLPVVAPDVETRRHCAEALKIAGIQTSLHYPFIPGFKAFAGSPDENRCAISQSFCRRVVTLPLFPTMSLSNAEFVSDSLIAAANSRLSSLRSPLSHE